MLQSPEQIEKGGRPEFESQYIINPNIHVIGGRFYRFKTETPGITATTLKMEYHVVNIQASYIQSATRL